MLEKLRNVPAIDIPDESLIETSKGITTSHSSENSKMIENLKKSLQTDIKRDIDNYILNHPLIICSIALSAIICLVIIIHCIYKKRVKFRVCIGKDKLEIDVESCTSTDSRKNTNKFNMKLKPALKSNQHQSLLGTLKNKLNSVTFSDELNQVSNENHPLNKLINELNQNTSSLDGQTERKNIIAKWKLLEELVGSSSQQQKIHQKQFRSPALVKSASDHTGINKVNYKKNDKFLCVEPNCKYESNYEEIKAHSRAHLNLRKAKYSCTICTFSCKQESKLHKHMVECHENFFSKLINTNKIV